MQQHAHSKMIEAGPPILPPTIVDQIKLWENERNRFIFSEGVLYSQFLSQTDFEVLRDHALSTGVLIWQSERSIFNNIFIFILELNKQVLIK